MIRKCTEKKSIFFLGTLKFFGIFFFVVTFCVFHAHIPKHMVYFACFACLDVIANQTGTYGRYLPTVQVLIKKVP